MPTGSRPLSAHRAAQQGVWRCTETWYAERESPSSRCHRDCRIAVTVQVFGVQAEELEDLQLVRRNSTAPAFDADWHCPQLACAPVVLHVTAAKSYGKAPARGRVAQ